MNRSTLKTTVLAAVAVLGLTAACGADASETPATQASTVSVEDPWVKAADTGMTAAFGTLRNASADDATIVSATAESVTDRVELHEITTDENGSMVMREKPDGITLPAGESHTLEPGGDHIMLMDLPKPVQPGQDVRVTLTFADDSTMSFTAPARSFAGAEEDYEGEMDMDGMDMEHGDGAMDHGDHG